MDSTFLFTGIFFAVFFVILEIITRRFSIPAEFSRKFAHMVGGFAVVFLSHRLSLTQYLWLTTVFLFVFTYCSRKKLLLSFSGITRRSYGEITYILGLMVLGILFYDRRDLFVPGLLVLIFPDSLAGLIGYRLGKSTKSFHGSLIYFCVCSAILVFFFPVAPALTISALCTFTEYASAYGLDNLTVPAVFSLAALVLF